MRYSYDSDQAAYAAMLDEDGGVIVFEKLPYLLWRPSQRLADPLNPEPYRQSDPKTMNFVTDMTKLKDLVTHHKPHAIVITAENSDSMFLQKDLQNMVYNLTLLGAPTRNQIGLQSIDVQLVDPALSVVYGVSKRGQVHYIITNSRSL